MKNKLKKSLSIDKSINSYKSYLVLFFYRNLHLAYLKNSKLCLLFYLVLREITFNLLGITAQISYKADIGDNIRLPHSAMGVVISSKAVISSNQTIYHQVTIGINENLPQEKQKIQINENCYLSCGCKIISAEVGKNCKIGPNAVVFKNLPDNTVYVCKGMEI